MKRSGLKFVAWAVDTYSLVVGGATPLQTPMETYERVHVEDSKTITSEVVETNLGWRTKALIQEAGKCSMTVGLHPGSLEDAKKFADKVIAKDHTCHDQCGGWERL
jgi:hypothetical protein